MLVGHVSVWWMQSCVSEWKFRLALCTFHVFVFYSTIVLNESYSDDSVITLVQLLTVCRYQWLADPAYWEWVCFKHPPRLCGQQAACICHWSRCVTLAVLHVVALCLYDWYISCLVWHVQSWFSIYVVIEYVGVLCFKQWSDDTVSTNKHVLSSSHYIFNFIHQNGSRSKQNINLTNLTKLLRSPQFITMMIQCTDHHLTHSSLQ